MHCSSCTGGRLGALPEPQRVSGGQIATEAFRTTFVKAAALGTSLWLLSRVTRLFGPLPGPRLERGELPARESSARAENAFWDAEQAAAAGRCGVAKRSWKRAQRYRNQAERRAEQGDRTGRDLKKPLRKARKQLQINCR